MSLDALDQLRARAVRITALTAGVLLIGTLGYRLVSHGEARWLDCLYMVVITVSTIGYGEVIPLDHNPAGRVFTMFVALFGIGIITYVMSTVTQVAVDGDLQRRWRRRRMLKSIETLSGHYILAGWSITAAPILRELAATERTVVLVVPDAAAVRAEMGDETPALLLEGDPTDDALLKKAGIERSAGLFTVDEQDHTNIVTVMTARSLRVDLRIVAGVRERHNETKLRRAGASAVVSPINIGGLRMSSEMIRPTVVSFLDTMLRDREKGLRIEEVKIGASADRKAIGELGLDRYGQSVLLALRHGETWAFKPAASATVATGDALIFMTTPAEREALEKALGG